MPVSGQMVVYFYPKPKGGDLGPDANFSLSHVHTAALSIKEVQLLLQFWDVNITTEFFEGREVEGMYQ